MVWVNKRVTRKVSPRGKSALAVLLGAVLVVGTLVSAPSAAQAEFAEGGTGGHRASIDWFTFGEPGQPIAEGQTYTNERAVGDDKIVSTCTISGINGEVSTYRSGEYLGDGLSRLYYNGGPGGANTMVSGITNTRFGTSANFLFDCSATYVTSSGATTEIPLQGLVVADAESSSKSTNEWIQVDPRPADADVTWRIIDRAKNASCPTDDTTMATPTVEGGLRLEPTRYECIGWASEGFGPMAVGFMEGATSAHVSMNGGGHSAVALGMVMSVDFGDAPASFGAAGAIFQPEWTGTEIHKGDAPRDVFADDFVLGAPGESPLTLGSRIDAETHHLHSWDALLDDETGRDLDDGTFPGSDEDALPLDALPRAEEGQLFNDGDPLLVECRGDGYVAGWLDWNRDGAFDPDTERSTVAECSGGSAELAWPDLAELGPAEGAYSPVVYLRLRIAASVDGLNPTGVLVPTGVGSAGEVEDYALGVPLIEAFKESDPLSGSPVLPGEEITYTLTLRNIGEVPGDIVYDDFIGGVLEKAEFVPGSISIESLNGPDPHGIQVVGDGPTGSPARLDITGTMQPGQIVNITYKVTVKAAAAAGDILENYLLHVDDDGEPFPDEETDECLASNPRCTTHEVLGSDLQVKKGSMPGDGRPVSPGDTVTYRIDFVNNGTAIAPVDYTDHLAEVLKYADLYPDSIKIYGAYVPGSAPPPAPEEYSIDAEYDEATQSIRVTGQMHPKNGGRVEYVVRVHDPITSPEAGTPALVNVVTEGSTTPPEVCEPGDELCTTHPVELPKLVVSKSADPTSGSAVVAGQEVKYTLTFDNTDGGAPATVNHVDDLTGVLDDATVTTEPTASAAGLTPARDGETLTIVGKVPAGERITVSYGVTVNNDGERGDEELANFVFEEGAEPPTTCEPGDDTCTTHPVEKPELRVSKAADPESGQAVIAGDVVKYTLTFDNSTGSAPAAVNHVDDLSDVIDDADISVEPVASAPGLVPVRTGATLSVTGAVPAGETITVTYSAEVKADDERGNEQLANFVFEEGSEPPTTCEPGDDTCTTHPVEKPDLKVSKSAGPASGESVIAGQEVTYTLTFDNSTGKAPAEVTHVDDLSDVLDDAELVAGPVVDPAGALVGVIDEATGLFPISGSIAAGAKATVSYTVKVKADGDRGNEQLANFLFEEGVEPPTTCEPGDDLCTTHPAESADVSVKKSSDPETGTEVVAGQAVKYTLTFTNTGTAPGDVDYTDNLSDVLDDAGITAQPASSDASLTPTLTGDELRVTGRLAAGATVTVSYEVTVNADGQRGNDVLGNVVVETGEDPVCDPEAENCTEHPVVFPAIEPAKGSDPASGTVLHEGDEVRYTLTFTNTGTGAGALAYRDNLAEVLDAADIVGGPTVTQGEGSSATATLSGDGIDVAGPIAPGDTVTVTYTARVKVGIDHGSRLTNYLLTPGEEVPALCLPENPRCTDHPAVVPELDVDKSADPASGTPVEADQVVTYTLWFHNWSPAEKRVDYVDTLIDVLDDANFVEGSLVVDTTALKAVLAGDEIRVTGTLAPDTETTVTYKVKVKPDAERVPEGEAPTGTTPNQLGNHVIESGGEPPTECLPTDWHCTVNPMPNVVAKKLSDPASGEPVVEGQEVGYTLQFENIGTAAGKVAYRDTLRDVLDDADFVDGSLAASEGLEASGPTENEIIVTGSLEAGATGTVAYRVKVKPDTERESTGNNQLANFVFGEGTEPPTTCEPGDDSCTTHPAADLVVTKGVDPESGTTVVAGQELSYTLTFSNLGNAPGEVAYEDHLGGVLDDATLVSGPDSDSELLSATLVGDKILIGGELHPGETVNVTYTVRVLPDADRGDDVLGNFVLKPGVTPPSVCEPESTLCTENPVSPTPEQPVPPLEETGGVSTLPWLLGGGAVILLGAALLLVRRGRASSRADSAGEASEPTDG